MRALILQSSRFGLARFLPGAAFPASRHTSPVLLLWHVIPEVAAKSAKRAAVANARSPQPLPPLRHAGLAQAFVHALALLQVRRVVAPPVVAELGDAEVGIEL